MCHSAIVCELYDNDSCFGHYAAFFQGGLHWFVLSLAVQTPVVPTLVCLTFKSVSGVINIVSTYSTTRVKSAKNHDSFVLLVLLIVSSLYINIVRWS